MSVGTPVDFTLRAGRLRGVVSARCSTGSTVSTVVAFTRASRTSSIRRPKEDPWPTAEGGNPRPNSPDKRLGDGHSATLDTEDPLRDPGQSPANAGTDFAWTSQRSCGPDRGSSITSRTSPRSATTKLVIMDPQGCILVTARRPRSTARVERPALGGGSASTGCRQTPRWPSTLIDKTRVARGELPSSATKQPGSRSDADGPCMSTGKSRRRTARHVRCGRCSCTKRRSSCLAQGPRPSRNSAGLRCRWWRLRRRQQPRTRASQGLLPGTPREMPVPTKELGVKGEPLYTWGGSKPNSAAP